MGAVDHPAEARRREEHDEAVDGRRYGHGRIVLKTRAERQGDGQGAVVDADFHADGLTSSESVLLSANLNIALLVLQIAGVWDENCVGDAGNCHVESNWRCSPVRTGPGRSI